MSESTSQNTNNNNNADDKREPILALTNDSGTIFTDYNGDRELRSITSINEIDTLTINTTFIDNDGRSEYDSNTITADPRNARVNDELNTQYMTDIKMTDRSAYANCMRCYTRNVVAKICKPRQMLIILRILKAVTFCFLILGFCSELMFVIWETFFVTDDVRNKVGGSRDIILRCYGLVLTIIALLIETDYSTASIYFNILKGFIPRSLLIFFIATIGMPPSLHHIYSDMEKKIYGEDNDENYDNNADDDNDLYIDDYFNGDDDGEYDVDVTKQIPKSTVVFQIVTSFILGVCGVTYLILGLLCFDKFTSKAFLCKAEDPIKSTAIPTNIK